MLLIWVVILLGFGFICTSIWARLGFRMLSPGGLLCLVWSLIWIIVKSDVFHYIDVSNMAITLGCIAVVSFCLGEILGLNINVKPKNYQYSWGQIHGFVKWNTIIASVFITCQIIAVFNKYGNVFNSSIAESIKLQRVAIGTDYVKGGVIGAIAVYAEPAKVFLYSSLFLVIPLSIKFPKELIVIFLVIVLNAVTFDVSWGSRTTIFDVVYSIYVIYVMTSMRSNGNKKKSRSNHVLSLLLVILIGFADLITAITRPDKTAQIAGIPVPFSLYQFITYNTSSVVAFAARFEHDRDSSYGLLTMTPWVDLLYRIKIYRNDNLFIYEIRNNFEQHEGHISEIVETPNTYSWLRYLWSDFGVLGVTLVPFIVGLIGGIASKMIVTAKSLPILPYVLIMIVYLTVMRSPVIWLLRSEWIQFSPVIIYGFIKFYAPLKMQKIK